MGQPGTRLVSSADCELHLQSLSFLSTAGSYTKSSKRREMELVCNSSNFNYMQLLTTYLQRKSLFSVILSSFSFCVIIYRFGMRKMFFDLVFCFFRMEANRKYKCRFNQRQAYWLQKKACHCTVWLDFISFIYFDVTFY